MHGTIVDTGFGDGDVIAPGLVSEGQLAVSMRLVHDLIDGIGATNDSIRLVKSICSGYAPGEPRILVGHEAPQFGLGTKVDIEIRWSEWYGLLLLSRNDVEFRNHGRHGGRGGGEVAEC